MQSIRLILALLLTTAAVFTQCLFAVDAAERPVALEHAVVFAEEGRFAAWPANNGVWIWEGRELLVGFVLGRYLEKPGHNIAEPYLSMLARSTDAGKTWTAENPERYVGDGAAISAPSGGIDFGAPGFALRVTGAGDHGNENGRGAFHYSSDRGRTWKGPFSFGPLPDAAEFKGLELSPRTDYSVNGPGDCLIFMSARDPKKWGSDRVFCARTTDAGATFKFVSWVVPLSDPYRAVMPCTVRCSKTKLVSAIRRREMGKDRSWIDAYVSPDDGKSWSFSNKVGVTGAENGNPPALVRLTDGRLCCVYGNRSVRRIIAKYSSDEGKTWTDDLVLRSNFRRDANNESDLGYPRLVQRADGRLVAFYYWSTKDRPQQHIAATIWNPNPPRNKETKNAKAGNRLGEMVTVPAGEFQMGTNFDEKLGGPMEFPRHSVQLPTFQIGKYEVTRGQYRKFIEAGGYHDPKYWSAAGWKWKESDDIVYAGMQGKFWKIVRPNKAEKRNQPEHWEPKQEWTGHGYGHPVFIQTDQHPVVGVTYYEAEAYCKWAGGRLPTEAEWEKAARWDAKKQHANIWPWGDAWDPEKCNNHVDHNPAAGGYQVNQSAPVGSYPTGASPYGCMDIVGNAYEWVADEAKSYPGNPKPIEHKGYHFVKGGCWDDGPNASVRCAYRGWYLPPSSG